MVNLKMDDKHYEHLHYIKYFTTKNAEIDKYLDRMLKIIDDMEKNFSIINPLTEWDRIEQATILSSEKSRKPEDIEERNKYIKNIEDKSKPVYGNKLSYLPLIFYEGCLREEVQPKLKEDINYQQDCAYLLYAMQALNKFRNNLEFAKMNIQMVKGKPVFSDNREIWPSQLLRMDNNKYPFVSNLFEKYGYTKLKEILKSRP
ncbi:MAG: hypothetical protein QXL66_03400 [Thermoplasmata archaeon]